ncbi:hypothetical protein IWQ62_002713 [Dispira parvispora]|uniref:Uncharacterized protein n=1 Tax=Dispira parvispora TaxID=1520584 RepID=A0A9W8E6X5_9FUNG|nr:hypothetical protein IWQ62_002713 [Dispira parvispora]
MLALVTAPRRGVFAAMANKATQFSVLSSPRFITVATRRVQLPKRASLSRPYMNISAYTVKDQMTEDDQARFQNRVDKVLLSYLQEAPETDDKSGVEDPANEAPQYVADPNTPVVAPSHKSAENQRSNVEYIHHFNE